MFTASSDYSTFLWQRTSKFLLLLFWCSGLMLGISAANVSGHNLSLLMHRATFQPVSIVGLCLRISFSFLITALAVIVFKPWLFLPAAFVRAFFLGILLQGIVITWSHAAWLVLLLYSSGRLLSLSSLIFFWFHHIPELRDCIKRDFVFCFFLHVLLGLIEYNFFAVDSFLFL